MCEQDWHLKMGCHLCVSLAPTSDNAEDQSGFEIGMVLLELSFLRLDICSYILLINNLPVSPVFCFPH